jgi:ATP-dependent 26S proteasome regulatory subunit
MHNALDSYTRSKDDNDAAGKPRSPKRADVSSNTAGSKVPLSLQEGALIVHSPNHGAGKTLLVRAIAQERLKCQAIHVIQPTSLLAQYGIDADAALESLLHSIVISAACQQKSICIILDHLDAMVPPPRSSRTSDGDAAMPVLKAIGE